MYVEVVVEVVVAVVLLALVVLLVDVLEPHFERKIGIVLVIEITCPPANPLAISTGCWRLCLSW